MYLIDPQRLALKKSPACRRLANRNKLTQSLTVKLHRPKGFEKTQSDSAPLRPNKITAVAAETRS